MQISLVELTILKWGNEEQKRSWLPRLCTGRSSRASASPSPTVGSDATRLRTTAKRDGDDWIINGRKMWISNGSVSKVALVFAQRDPSKGHKGITAFLIDREKRPTAARRCTASSGCAHPIRSELILDDVRVPDSARLGEVGEGFKIAMSALDSGRYSVAAGAVGIGARGASTHRSRTPRSASLRQADRGPPARGRS